MKAAPLIRKALIVLFWLVVWQLVSLLVNNDILLSGPIETAVVLFYDLGKAAFWSSIGFTLLRITIGFFAALILALLFAGLAARFKWLSELLQPAITFIKSVPIVCFIVLLLIWFGSRWVSLIAVFLVAFPAIYFSALEGLEQRDAKMMEMLKVFRVPWQRRSLAFYWPTMQPFLQATSKMAVGMSWKSGVAAELIGLPLGSIGANIYQAKITLSSVDIFAWTIVVVAASVICEKLFLLFLDHSADWSWSLALPKPTGRPADIKQPQDILIEHLSKSFAEKPVISMLDISLPAGGKLALTSASGSGKTTLLRLLAHLERPDGGEFSVPEVASMVFQEARLFEQRSALDNLCLVAGLEHSESELRLSLSELLPPDSLDSPASELSGGMRRRVELVRALATPSQIVLLDEPFNGLDEANVELARHFVLDHLQGRSLVIASHDPSDVTAFQAQELSVLDCDKELLSEMS